MKTHLSKTTSGFLLTTVFLVLVSFISVHASQQEWYGNQHFNFVADQDYTMIHINKNPWESFTCSIEPRQLMNNPVIEVEVSSEQDIILRMDISDGVFVSDQQMTIEKPVSGTGLTYVLDYDFREVLSEIDFSEELFLIFYVQPGEKFEGVINLNIKNFDAEPVTETLKSQTVELPFAVYPSPANTFTNVQIPDDSYHTLRLLDAGGKQVQVHSVRSFASQTFVMELANVLKGYYVVQLIGDTEILTEKLIVN
ncbi:MAG: T9SS type A sorting domain-containing protein [Bacteroidales bacterium]